KVAVCRATWPGAPSNSKVCTMASGDGSPWKTPWKPYLLPSASVWTYRQVPPSRASQRSMAKARSCGPSHCATSSGSMWARNTRSRGALNSRVMVICGMPGSAVFCVLLIVVSLRYGHLLLARALFLAGLQGGEQVVEPLVAFIPEPLVAGEPGGHLAQRRGLQAAEPGGRPPATRDQARVLQHLQVPGDRRLGHAERRGELGDGGLTVGETGQDRPPDRVGECPEHETEPVTTHS